MELVDVPRYRSRPGIKDVPWKRPWTRKLGCLLGDYVATGLCILGTWVEFHIRHHEWTIPHSITPVVDTQTSTAWTVESGVPSIAQRYHSSRHHLPKPLGGFLRLCHRKQLPICADCVLNIRRSHTICPSDPCPAFTKSTAGCGSLVLTMCQSAYSLICPMVHCLRWL